METVKVRIKGGKVTIETDGFVGESCQKATESLERRLGKKVGEIAKPELYLTAENDLQAGS